MRSFSRFICGPCIVLGLFLIFISANVYAAESGEYGPSWPLIANGLFGLILLIIGTYVKAYKDAIGEKIKDLNAKLDEHGEQADINANLVRGLEMRMIQNYHSKSDIREVISLALAPVSLQLNLLANSSAELHRKIDRIKDE